MPTTDSNLTGTFIANTYQKLLQIDNQYGKLGNATFDINNITNDEHTILNGLGQALPGVVIDHTSDANGGLFLMALNGVVNQYQGIQLGNPSSTNTSAWGIKFGKTGGHEFRMFLSNMGNLWVGYMNNPNDITAGSTGYSLYVKDGIYVTGSTPRIRMDNNSSEFLVRQNGTNGFSPQVDFPIHFLTVDFGQTDNPTENLDANLNIPVSDWNVAVIGTDWGNEGSGSPIVYTYINGNTWWVRADVIGDDDNDTVVTCQFLIVHKSVSSRVNNNLFGNSNGSNGSSSTKPFITYTGNTLHAAPGG